MNTDAVRRDLGEILAHGEPENGIGQDEAADQPAQPETGETPTTLPVAPATSGEAAKREGVIAVDFGGLGPAVA